MKMGLREANQNFSKAIKAIKAGKTIVLTERGTPIATIHPIRGRGYEYDELQLLRDEGFLETRSFDAILKRIQNDRQTWDLVSLSIEILQSAEGIVQQFNVRSLDAIHLATARALQSRLNRPLSFITADAQQKKAASQLD